MTKVITYGTYDLLHYGHINLLKRARALGDYLIVGVTSDDFDKKRGKINNQQSLMERIESIKATGLADEIIVEEYEGQKIDDIRRYDIDIFTVGSDWEGNFDYLNEFCKVIYLPRTEGVSSSEIRSKKRTLKIGILGNPDIAPKFLKEIKYVNGVELVECNEDLSNVDAVYVLTLPKDHYKDVLFALEKGKHVICSSPFAIKKEQCQELINIANKKNLILTEGIKTAYSTAYSRILLLVKSGIIGDVLSVDVNCSSMALNLLSKDVNLSECYNSICAWGPIALLPVFQLLGTEYLKKTIVSKLINDELFFDGFTKIDFIYKNAVASVKVAQTAKTEGELIISGTKGYVYVPAPWWNTDYFEVRFENQTNNKRYFYQLDGDGIRYEIVAFARSIENQCNNKYINEDVSIAISSVIDDFYSGNYISI